MSKNQKTIALQDEKTVQSVFEIYAMSRIAKGLTEKTVTTYKQQFHAISKHLNTDKPIDQIKKSDIDMMILKMRQANLSPVSIQTYTRCLRAFFNWCREEEYSTLSIKLYKAEEAVKEAYTDTELGLLLKKPDKKKCTFAEYRDWTIINFLINSGCRASTIRGILIKDLDLDNRLVYYRHNKGKKVQTIPLCNAMVSILKDYILIRKGKPDDFLFCNDTGEELTENALRKTIEKYNRSRGVSKTSIHLFRHTFAKKYLLDCGGDAFTLQKLLGHSTLEMTKHYCNLYNADIQNKFESMCPLNTIRSVSKSKIKMN